MSASLDSTAVQCDFSEILIGIIGSVNTKRPLRRMRWRRRGTEGAYAWRGGLVGLTRVELVTSSLSGTRSNQLSYKPSWSWWRQPDSDRRHPACKAGALPAEPCPRERGGAPRHSPEGARNTKEAMRELQLRPLKGLLLRKEVIQPLVPQRLPCYDFIPITTHTLGGQMPDFGCRRLS